MKKGKESLKDLWESNQKIQYEYYEVTQKSREKERGRKYIWRNNGFKFPKSEEENGHPDS